jgi:hypothetical protein
VPLVAAVRALAFAAAILYAGFAWSCFRLVLDYDDGHALAIGEGAFTLLGAAALAAAAFARRHAATSALLGTLPLVAWFAATPWNSGPPFLAASLVVPVVAGAVLGRERLRTRAAS